MIGSGPGGALLAHKLATAGRSVVLAEVGPVVRKRDYKREVGYTLTHFFWNGGLRRTRGNMFMPTMQARCLGGGSVFNSAICLRTPKFGFDKWAHDHGVEGINVESLEPHYQSVGGFLNVKPVEPEVQGRRNELFRDACEQVGFTPTVIERNERGCRGSAECLTGCPTQAKLSVDIRGVPEMLDAGGRVYTSVSAEELILDGHSVRGVIGTVIEPLTGRKTEKVRITARCTILAAGALATPVIMQRSGIDRDPVGRNLQFHPGTALMGIFPDEVASWSGATQGYHCLDFVDQGIKLESLWAAAALMAIRFPGVGQDFQETLSKYRSMACWDVWVSGEDSVGRIRHLPGGRPDIQYRVGEGDIRRMQEGMAKLTEMFFSVGAVGVLTGLQGPVAMVTEKEGAGMLRRGRFEPHDFPVASNHVFGSTSMGGDPSRHVVDSFGAVYDYDDLYICDTGIMPTTPAANPMFTLMALADRLGERLLTLY